jgi:glutamate racemase
MEPAVKPAAESTQSGVVGVLATPATFHGELYASVVDRFANDITVLQAVCPGLVTQIEMGEFNSTKTREILENALYPMIEKGIDKVVLGCTHYPFVIPLIQEIVGSNVQVVDPAPAVARQTQRVLMSINQNNGFEVNGNTSYLTTGNRADLETQVERILGKRVDVSVLFWDSGELNDPNLSTILHTKD